MKRLIAITLGVALAGLGTVAIAARNSSGTYSRPAGNPVTTMTPITSTWANTLTADLATELTDSLSRSGKGGMLAPLRVTNGSVALPTLSFTNSTNSGLYLIAANEVGLTLGGALTTDWSTTLTSSAVPYYFGSWATFAGSTTTQGRARFSGGVMETEFLSSVTVDGTVRFLGSTFIPTAVTSTEAVQKGYVDNYVGMITTTDPLEISNGSGLSTHSCAYATVAAKTTVPAGWDCQNATTGMGTEQWSIDEVYIVGTTAQVRWCTNNQGPGVVNPTTRAYRFRCYKAP